MSSLSASRRAALLVLAPFVLGLPLCSQELEEGRLRRAVVRPATPYRVDERLVAADRVVVKFREGVRVRLAGDDLVSPDGVDLARVRDAIGEAAVGPLFTRPVGELDRERTALQTRMPRREDPLADLNNYHLVQTGGAEDTERLVNALLALDAVETAYAEPLPLPLSRPPLEDIPPPTPDFEALQTYLDASPAGYGFRAVERVVGARLPDDRMAQLEGGWTLGHEDCHWLDTGRYVGSPPSGRYTSNPWPEHGSACVGIMAAGRNAYGVRGFGSDCREFWLCSLTNGSANMVSLMTAALGPGDVMSSSFAFGINYQGQTMHAPRDWPQADFDAIRLAAAKGIHYTFGAGNTGQDLANTAIYGNRYLPGSASSGGYVIGATDPGAGSRVSWSNFGQVHVIANGWGSGVTTIAYGDLFDPNDPRQRYTDTFGGTSAAGPQVAGVIAAYVGIVEEQLGMVLSVSEVKAALRATGTPVSGSVGNRPNLGALLARHGLPDALVATSDASPGGTFSYDLSGSAGEVFAVALSLGRGRTVLGANRPLLLDPQRLGILATGALGPSGRLQAQVPVPNEVSLRNLDLFLQAALIRGGALHLSSSAAVWIR